MAYYIVSTDRLLANFFALFVLLGCRPQADRNFAKMRWHKMGRSRGYFLLKEGGGKFGDADSLWLEAEGFMTEKKGKAVFVPLVDSLAIAQLEVFARPAVTQAMKDILRKNSEGYFRYDPSEELLSDIIVKVFLQGNIQKQQIDSMISTLQSWPDVRAVKYISADEALKDFIKEEGENFRKVLDVNPLPASIDLRLNSAYREGRLDSFAKNIGSTFPNEVFEVIYPKSLYKEFGGRLYVFHFKTTGE